MAHTGFVPTANGFHFVNYFQLHFPVKYPLPFVGSVALDDVVYGLCGGMCFTALDYFTLNQTPPDYNRPDAIDQKLLSYLCQRQLDSLSIPILIKIFDWMLSDPAKNATRMARTELPKMRRSLDSGAPVVLLLIRVQGPGNPTHNHQVLAVGYDFDNETKDMTIYLYDPNHPGEEPTIKLNLAHPAQGVNLVESTGEPLFGIFTVPYKAQVTVPSSQPPTAAVSFAAEVAPGFRLSWPVDSHRVNQKFGENPQSYNGFGLPGHEGLDLFAPTGANVYAAAAGTIYQANQPKNHPYGLHVRIRHEVDGKTYHTIYAHLSETCVQEGQTVAAGELIGQADNTGNSFGSHLHLTLKIDGAQTPGYPPGIVDPWPFLQDSEPLPAASGVVAYTTAQVNLRAAADTGSRTQAVIPAGEVLSVLGDVAAARAHLGQASQWLQVMTGSGQSGYISAGFLQPIEGQAFPPSDLIIYPFDVLNLRNGPGTVFEVVATVGPADALVVLGDAASARARVGAKDQWIQVQTQDGKRGFVASWLVHLTGQAAPTTGLSVYPVATINVRARPEVDGNILTIVSPGDTLAVLGDKDQEAAKIGQENQWLNVRTPGKVNGYVAAWYVQSSPLVPPAQNLQPAAGQLVVYPTAGVNLRAQPSVNSPRVNGAEQNEALQVVETDLNAARSKLGQQDAWLYVQKSSGARGWAAAWYLSQSPA